MVPKRTYPSVRYIRQDQTNFSNVIDEMKGETKIQTREYLAESMQELHSNAITLLLQHYYIFYSSDSCASILKVP